MQMKVPRKSAQERELGFRLNKCILTLVYVTCTRLNGNWVGERDFQIRGTSSYPFFLLFFLFLHDIGYIPGQPEYPPR